MEFINVTPFPPFFFSNIDHADKVFHIIVFKGTFEYKPNEVMKPCQFQDELVTADRYHDDDDTASILHESDVVPFKPRSDIIVTGHSYAPGGLPMESWGTRVVVGQHQKALAIHGERHWRKRGLGWSLSRPEPTLSVPLRYEYAYGGSWGTGNKTTYYEQNPVGMGFAGFGKFEYQSIQAPQIESIEDPVQEFGKHYRPEGFGFIGKGWLPRRELVGTTDDEWLQNEHPSLPYDFDFSFYNGAHPDLIYPGMLRGDEPITLINLHPQYRTIKTRLPGLMIGARINKAVVARAYLDTLILEPENLRAHLTWRATFRMDEDIEHIEARLVEMVELSQAQSKPTGAVHG